MFKKIKSALQKEYCELVVSLSVPGLQKYLASRGIPFDVKVDPDEERLRTVVIRVINGKFWLYRCTNVFDLDYDHDLVVEQDERDDSVSVSLITRKKGVGGEHATEIVSGIPVGLMCELSVEGEKAPGMFASMKDYEQLIESFKQLVGALPYKTRVDDEFRLDIDDYIRFHCYHVVTY